MRVLVVEDNARVASLVGDALLAAGHFVTAVSTKSDAVAAAGENIDLAIVDVGLPDGSGLDLCRELRRCGLTFPVVVLSARGAIGDRIAGLDAGADDYVPKPFATSELLARVRALGRRGPRWTESIKTFGDVIIDRDRRTVTRGGVKIPLTPREIDIVTALAWRDGRVVARDALLEMIWGASSASEAASLDVLISRIRRKVGHSRDEEIIRTVRGMGYAWALGRSNPI